VETLPDAIVQSLGDFPCPTCSSRLACQKDFPTASRLRQEQQRHTKSIQALRTSLWHRFQERVTVLQTFGYLTPTAQLTADGEWARLIRIDHSLLITELIRAEAFTGADPSLLTGIMASLAHDDDRPGAFPRISAGLSSLLRQVRKLTESLAPHEDPPLLRADVAALAERWVAEPTLTWIGLCRLTTMAEGDIYRLLARTIEFLSQLQTLKGTHPGLADSAAEALTLIRRGVLEELP
jgi:ATP-dependent RNA helicase HelY